MTVTAPDDSGLMVGWLFPLEKFARVAVTRECPHCGRRHTAVSWAGTIVALECGCDIHPECVGRPCPHL